MKPLFFFLSFLCISLTAVSQPAYFSATKAGLSLREQPATSAKALDKIPYGEKLMLSSDNGERVLVSSEGFSGVWLKVNYKGKTGYVASCYTLPLTPPKESVKTLKGYFAQVSSTAGSPLVVKRNDAAIAEMGESTLTKQLYKNGMELQKTEAYENSSELYLLPGFSIDQCFLLLRLMNMYPTLVGEKDPLPLKNSSSKGDGFTKTIEVEKEKNMGNPPPVKKIAIITEEGVITQLEIYMIDQQGIIYWASGV